MPSIQDRLLETHLKRRFSNISNLVTRLKISCQTLFTPQNQNIATHICYLRRSSINSVLNYRHTK